MYMLKSMTSPQAYWYCGLLAVHPHRYPIRQEWYWHQTNWQALKTSKNIMVNVAIP